METLPVIQVTVARLEAGDEVWIGATRDGDASSGRVMARDAGGVFIRWDDKAEVMYISNRSGHTHRLYRLTQDEDWVSSTAVMFKNLDDGRTWDQCEAAARRLLATQHRRPRPKP